MRYKIILIIAVILGLAFLVLRYRVKEPSQTAKLDVIKVKSLKSQIQARGSVESKNVANLHFQTGGKLVYLPFKEGDYIKKGQIIGSLDTYALQEELTQALNNYRLTRDEFDQAQIDNNRVLNGQQKYSLEVLNKNGFSGNEEYNILNNTVKRVLDQNQANLDNSVINVQLANYAFQLSSLTSPIAGVLTYEDVITPGVNVTPSTVFTVSDPNQLIFKAYVLENDIDSISLGAKTQIDLASGKRISGTVEKIYPEKTTLANGDKAYRTDIESNSSLIQNAKLGETGTVLISNSNKQGAILIPTWTILGSAYVWVYKNGAPMLQKVVAGPEYSTYTQIIKGLEPGDKIIENPESIIVNKYQMF